MLLSDYGRGSLGELIREIRLRVTLYYIGPTIEM